MPQICCGLLTRFNFCWALYCWLVDLWAIIMGESAFTWSASGFLRWLPSRVGGIAPNTPTLIAARGLQGIGGALMVPGSLAIISAYFDSDSRGQAIGTWAAFTTMTSVAGPIIGGIFADIGFWRGIFFLNVPLAIVALYVLIKYVPESKDEEAAKKLDIVGAVIITLSLAGIVFGAQEIGRAGIDGFSNPLLVGALLLGIAGVGVFIWYENRTPHPMINLTLFRSRTFSGANLLTLFLYGALGGALFFLPLNLIQVQGYDASIAGLANLPFSVLLIAMSRWAGGLVDSIGPRLPLIGGPIIVGFGFLALSLPGITNGPSDYWTTFFPGIVLFGFGMGIVVSPLTTTVMGSVPQHNAGIASGINNTMSRASGVLAVALMGGVALLFFQNTLNTDLNTLNLDTQTQAILQDESDNLAGMEIPAYLDETTAANVQQVIDQSFMDTFQLIMLIAAVMCWLSALMAYRLIDKRLEPPESLMREPTDDALSEQDE